MTASNVRPRPRRRAVVILGTVAGWLVVALLGFTAFALAFSLTAEPAAADNCKDLVKGFTDLLDEANVQDCLRTGGPYGAILGTVVAATAAGIGAAGLSGRRNPPDDGPPPAEEPCDEAKNMKEHALALLAKRRAKEAQITQEWQKIAADAAHFAQMYRLLKEQEFKLGQLRVLATVGYTSAVAGALLGLHSTLGSLKVLAGERLAAVELAGLSPAGALLGKAKVALGFAAGGAAAAVIATQLPSRSFDPGDFFGGNTAAPLWAKMSQVAGTYQTTAHAFNDAARAWADSAQRDLAEIDQDIQNARSRLRTSFSLCSGQAADEIEFQDFDPTGTILIPQAQTQFGSVWWFGGSWGAFGGLGL
jgi:hypothetical protein